MDNITGLLIFSIVKGNNLDFRTFSYYIKSYPLALMMSSWGRVYRQG